MPRKHIPCKDVAVLVRAALKESFPGVKFSVRSSTYSGGASISVGWTDGPTQREVDPVIKVFQGATFDGMIDLKSYNNHTLNGEQVSFGADYINGSREHSRAHLERCLDYALAHDGDLTGQKREDFKFSGSDQWGWWLQNLAYIPSVNRTAGDIVSDFARRTSADFYVNHSPTAESVRLLKEA